MPNPPRALPTRILITGIAGSGGSYLAEYITAHYPTVEVHGIARWRSSRANLRHLGERVAVHECDLTDLASLLRVLQNVTPDAVFHLAAHANVRASFDTPAAVLQGNISGTCNLFEGLRLLGLDPVIQLCSSSEVYGQVHPHEVPISEDNPLRPASPYSVSKVAQDLLGRTYHLAFGMRVITTRMFTYLNPRRDDLFATAFALQVARIEAGLQDELRHGNLESVRTIIDVRDAMSAYWAALAQGEFGAVYNIGGTTTLSVGDVLQFLIDAARVPIPTRPDPALFRPADVTLQIPDMSRFLAATGWTARYTFAESLNDLLAACRSRVAREVACGAS